MNRSVCKLRNSCPNSAGSRQIYHLIQRIIKHFSAINLFFFVISRMMTSQGRSENSDQSRPLHPMLPNADPPEQRLVIEPSFISVSRDFTPYFHFRCVARATFDRNLNHSAVACFLVMACVAYSRVKLKTLSSLLKLQCNLYIQAKSRNACENFTTCNIINLNASYYSLLLILRTVSTKEALQGRSSCRFVASL